MFTTLTDLSEKPAVLRAAAALASSAKWKKGSGAPGRDTSGLPWFAIASRTIEKPRLAGGGAQTEKETLPPGFRTRKASLSAACGSGR